MPNKSRKIIFYCIYIMLVTCILFTGCNGDTDKDVHSNDTLSTPESTPESIQESTPDKSRNPTFDNEVLMDIKNRLLDFDIEDSIVGYNAEGNIIVWAEPSGNLLRRDFYVQEPKLIYEYYHCYLANKIICAIKGIDCIYLINSFNVDCYLTQLTKATFEKNDSSNIFKSIDGFFSESREIYKHVDYQQYFDYLPDTGQLSRLPIQTAFKRIFGERFIDYTFELPTSEAESITVEIECEKNDSTQYYETISNELAQAFVSSIGVYETQYWNSIVYVKFIYKIQGETQFEVGMDNLQYKMWREAGLDPSEWWRYSSLGKCDIPFSSIIMKDDQDVSNNTERNLEYSDFMGQLKEKKDIKTFALEKDEAGYNLVLSLECGSVEGLYEKQLQITKDLFEMPVQSIWFISKADNKTKVSFIDRERYNTLIYSSQNIDADFLAEDWPIAAKIFWEII